MFRYTQPLRRLCTVVSSASNLVVTSKCAQRVLKVTAAKQDKLLRLSVEGGGCSGFSYKFSLAKEAGPDDVVIQHEGAAVVVDRDSLEKVRGATVDFVEEMKGQSFQVTQNPNADLTCSCGTSFSIKL